LITLEKITTKYSETEDRVRISALTAESSIIVLWISQRMLTRLVPLILRWVDERNNPVSQIDVKSKELMNDFAQYEAHTELKPEKPVNPENHKPEDPMACESSWLIHKVDVTHFDQAIELNFKDAQDNAAKLLLTKLYARQWLMILHSQWTKSEWAMQIWPAWFTKSSGKPIDEMH
jgi:hypothetical protein